jgi:hypothetical protein
MRGALQRRFLACRSVSRFHLGRGCNDDDRSSAERRPDAFQPTLRSQDALRQTVQLAGGSRQKTLPDAWRCTGIGRATRQNALKHGLYTREAVEERRQLQALLRQSRELLKSIK